MPNHFFNAKFNFLKWDLILVWKCKLRSKKCNREANQKKEINLTKTLFLFCGLLKQGKKNKQKKEKRGLEEGAKESWKRR